jgi:hypothetical protein
MGSGLRWCVSAAGEWGGGEPRLAPGSGWRWPVSGVAVSHGGRLAVGSNGRVIVELEVREAERERQTLLVDWRFGEPNWALVRHLG